MSIGAWPENKTTYICAVCHLPGVGQHNSRVHPGACRKQRKAAIQKRWAARQKAKAKAAA